MDYKKKQEIPFGAFDSKLMYQEINIPEGFEATIEGNAIVLKKTESEDEKIRKALIKGVQDNKNASWAKFGGIDIDEVLVWLEKQGEKPQGKSAVEAAKEEKSDNRNCINNADKDEHEFQVGDWVISKRNRNVYHILNIEDNEYQAETLYGIFWYDKLYFEGFCRHWNIDDAKPGDVLANSQSIFIFKGIYMAGKPESYCAIMNGYFFCCSEGCWTNEQCYPATKEQRGILFQKMHKAGYEWDDEKKELKLLISNGGDFESNNSKQKPAWSEKDERMLRDVISYAEHEISFKNTPQLNWLKSLKDKYTWKPSEEQIKVCKEVYADMLSAKGFDLGTVNSELNRLEEKLKKLREE